MAKEPKFTLEDWEDWYPTKKAFDVALKTLGTHEFSEAVVDRIRGGHIQAAARSASSTKGHGPTEPRPDPFIIPLGFWRDWIADTSKLRAGDAKFHIPPHHYGGSYRTDPVWDVVCFGIRLDPKQVRLHFPDDDEIAPAADLPVYGPAEKGPPVSPAALEAWAKAYRLAYQGKDDKLETAYRSAAGAFPGRSVSREQIRKLVGGDRKRGPKGPRET